MQVQRPRRSRQPSLASRAKAGAPKPDCAPRSFAQRRGRRRACVRELRLGKPPVRRIKEASITEPIAARVTAEKKAELRARALALRAAKARPQAAAAVAEHALRHFSFTRADIVSAYLAMQEELDPAPLVQALDERGVALALPAVIAKGAPLAFRRWRPGDVLERGTFGTRHPPPSAQTVRPTIVLAPLLAFDGEGYRLGYGGGYYDRTLYALRKQGPLLAVGLAYAFQEVPALPRAPHDARLDCVVTENGVRRFEKAREPRP